MIYIGCDHGGFELKNVIIDFLKEKSVEVCDCGTYTSDSVDYPNIAKNVCEKVVGSPDKGILVCGTGVGMSIAANKIKGIRAVVASDAFSVRMSRAHNNANVLCLGQRVLGNSLALMLVDEFLKSEFEGGRHEHRVELITRLEG